MYTPKLPDEHVNIPKQNMVLQSIKLFAAVGIISLILYLLMAVSLRFVVKYITPEQEQKLVELSTWRTPEIKYDPYLQKIVDKLSLCSELPYKVRIGYISLGEINAIAFPGGIIGITKEMRNEVKNENELAFIIGHELAHFKNKDHLKGFGNSLILGVVSLLLGQDYGEFFGYSLQFTQAKFSQNIEKEADRLSLDMMQCAYGNVNQASSLFERINDGKHWNYFLSSHPDFDERIEEMNLYIKEKHFKTEGDIIPLPKQSK